MIIFDSITPTTGNSSILRFRNENGKIVDIPIDKNIANLISIYIERISTAIPKVVERADDPDHE